MKVTLTQALSTMHSQRSNCLTVIQHCTQDMIVKGVNVPHFSKMSGDKSGPKSASTSYVFQILGDIRKQQQAIYTMYNQNELDTTKTSYPDPEPHPSFRTTIPSQRPAPMTGTSRQANPVHVHAFPVQNTSQSGPPAPCAHVHNLPKQVCKPGELLACLEKSPAPTQWKDFCDQIPIDETSHSVTLFQLL